MTSTTDTSGSATANDGTSTVAAAGAPPAEHMMPAEVAAKRLTFADILDRRRGDSRPGLLFEDESYTWDEVVREAEKRAVVLLEHKREGKPFHVGVLLENVPDYIFLIGAGALSGAFLSGQVGGRGFL